MVDTGQGRRRIRIYGLAAQGLALWRGAYPYSHALFDVGASVLAVVADLFGEDSYFVDAEAFWVQQSVPITQAVEQCKETGWVEVTVLDTGTYFARWDHCTCSKADQGYVFV